MLSRSSTQSNTNDSSTGGQEFDHDEEDEIRDLTGQVSNHHQAQHQESLDNQGSFSRLGAGAQVLKL